MDKNMLIHLDQDLIDNSATRLPICLCIDVSDTMTYVLPNTGFVESGETGVDDEGNTVVFGSGGIKRIDKLIEGLEKFKEELINDAVARTSAEICIVSFSDSAECLTEFCSADKFEVPQLSTGGKTDMGAGVNLALDKLEERKNLYKEMGIDYYQPMLVLFSDGAANGNKSVFMSASRRACDLVNDKKLTCLPIAIGVDDDGENQAEVASAINCLKSFSPKNSPKSLNAIKFTDFFEWLSKSVSIRSRSQVGDIITAPSTETWTL